MNWQEALAEIKSHDFDANLNVVSSISLFMNAARREPPVVVLYQAMQGSGVVSEEVLGHVYDLSAQDVDLNYENPGDTALAILLWLLSLGQVTYARIAAGRVSGAANCYYAWKVAQSILFPSSAPVTGGDMSMGQSDNMKRQISSGVGGTVVNVSQLSGRTGKLSPRIAAIIDTDGDLRAASGGGGFS